MNREEFRKARENGRFDFSGVYFLGENLWHTDFQRTSLGGANMFKSNCTLANFLEARCHNAIFQSVDFTLAGFQRAFCWLADFRCSDCRRVDFREADLTKADFRDAKNLETANFDGAVLDGAIGLPNNLITKNGGDR